jgi:pimeloyl-ACP methyl ester carboxylesterase/DNA-binding CsgD family transcriptional regulator
VEYDIESPVWRSWLQALSAENTFIRYDQRGCGLSDRNVEAQSLEAWVGDLEAVVDSLGLERFPLIGMSQGGAIAVAYALRHPEKVSRLVLVGAYAQGALGRAENEEQRLEAETLVNLVRLGWGRDDDTFRRVFTRLFIPGGTEEQHKWWTELERISASAEDAARILEAFHQVDVRDMASRLRIPTLVLHARGDRRAPFEQGRRLASLIPGARFVPLESDNHVLLKIEPAWQAFLSELRNFIGQEGGRRYGDVGGELTSAERDVLELLAHGLDNRTIAQQLGKSEKTVRNQVSSILGKLGVASRAEAIVLSREAAPDG